MITAKQATELFKACKAQQELAKKEADEILDSLSKAIEEAASNGDLNVSLYLFQASQCEELPYVKFQNKRLAKCSTARYTVNDYIYKGLIEAGFKVIYHNMRPEETYNEFYKEWMKVECSHFTISWKAE